jgi:membrane protein YqaA with SNARE-associated domain
MHIEQWLGAMVAQYGYVGIFLVSLIGSLSIVIPVPYTILIFTFGRVLNPAFIAVAGGVGSGLGEIAGYALGYLGRAVVSKERQRKMDCFLGIFRRYGPLTIFFFALTPLPDDLLFIPLGIMRYNLLKAFIPCLLGKTLMCFALAYGGHMSIDFVESIFGGYGGTVTTIVSTSLLVGVVYLMYKIDWEKYFPLEQNGDKSA